MRELERLVDDGLTAEEFELTRTFLRKYAPHYAETTAAKLGYAMDDRFYGIEGDGHLTRFRRMMDELEVDDVNAAIKRHLQYRDIKIAIVTGQAEWLRAVLASGEPTPIAYAAQKPDEMLAEDEIIAAVPLAIEEARIDVVPVTEMFER